MIKRLITWLCERYFKKNSHKWIEPKRLCPVCHVGMDVFIAKAGDIVEAVDLIEHGYKCSSTAYKCNKCEYKCNSAWKIERYDKELEVVK